MKHAHIDKDTNIVFVGAGRQIRIWSENLWNEREQTRDFVKMRAANGQKAVKSRTVEKHGAASLIFQPDGRQRP